MGRKTLLFLCCGFIACAGCTTGKPVGKAIIEQKELAVPVSKEWQVKERAPDLTDERGRLPFQTEESLRPEGERVPVTPSERQRIQTQQ